MKHPVSHILILICLIFLACTEQSNETESVLKLGKVNTIEGLVELSEQWVQDSSTYWIRDRNRNRQEIKSIDTSSTANYSMTKKYQIKLINDLTIKKLIDIDPRTQSKISETDIYTMRLSANIESRLGLTYNYETGRYYADYLDSIATHEKMMSNKMKADSMMNYAEDRGLYLCGTAYHEILWKDLPFLAIPREIEKDSALVVIEEWTNK